MKKVLVVEDESYMREELEQMLIKAGYAVDEPDSFEGAVEYILRSVPDMVLLDLNLPGASGFQICQEIKRKSAIPVLVLTSRDQMKDELLALKLGADEYLTKPCRRERLLARISNVLKRYEGRPHLLEGGGYLLDCQTYTIYINGQSMVLPGKQGKLLEMFTLRGQEMITRDELNLALWGTTEYMDENALQVNITRLRRIMTKLSMKQEIAAVPGKGYKMVMEEPNEENLDDREEI